MMLILMNLQFNKLYFLCLLNAFNQLGNLCRCTGYRPILEAFQNCFLNECPPSPVSDIEDVGHCSNALETPRNVIFESGGDELSRIESSIV